MLQVFHLQLTHAALTAERAVMYALNFDLPKYNVHKLVLDLHENCALGQEFCQSEDGQNLFKVAFETVSHACACTHYPDMHAIATLVCQPLLSVYE